jgi:hypothetical protein
MLRDSALEASHSAQRRLNMIDGDSQMARRLADEKVRQANAHNVLSRLLSSANQWLFQLRLPPSCHLEPVTTNSRVRLFVHKAKRKVRIFSVSCRSAMNLVRGSLSAVAMRNSGSVWRRAFATTNSEGGMPRRMVRSQDPNESQTRLGSNDGKTLEQSLG